MKKRYLLSSFTFSLLFVGCMHRHTIKGRADSEYPEGAVVNIAFPEVKEGDIVRLYTESCGSINRNKGPSVSKGCRKTFMGEAIVVKIVNKDQVVIVPNDGVKIDSDMTVERH